MPTGIELIQQERIEQIEKHGFSLKSDRYYKKKQLEQAAEYCLMLAKYSHFTNKNVFWPDGWGRYFEQKIHAKSPIQKLIVAGAFYMAENARRGDNFHDYIINELAAEIDRLQALEGKGEEKKEAGK